ncbi:NPL4 family [Carpediemonas membranifera]|uniref:NPL4 family n=1 Tax=Carpediemonas membranifera TaxID=201153 RepID=A0A8J6APW4_9EUKA|nr:NPL4 family [Carpediemonas membranifera]|eukprot:KAG9390601.1 NPL4 family [Carpediemonas membranifera]
MIIRVRTTGGMKRMEFDEKHATVKDLRARLAEEYNTTGDQPIYMGPTPTGKPLVAKLSHKLANEGFKNGTQIFFDEKNIAQEPSALEQSGKNFTVHEAKDKRPRPPHIGPDCTHDATMRCHQCFEAYYKDQKDPLAISDDEEAPPVYARKNMRDARYLHYQQSLIPHIKHQDTGRVRTVSLAQHVVEQFNAGLVTYEYYHRRLAILFGRFDQDNETVIVETSYEPKQDFNTDTQQIRLGDDEHFDRVRTLGTFLGMEPVGWIVSHPMISDEDGAPLRASEVVQAASWQLEFDTRFVTVTVSVDDDKQLSVDAFQVSDQACKMARKGFFDCPQSSDEPFSCQTTKEVDINAEMVKSVGTPYLTVPVGITTHDGVFGGDFPVQNRLIEPTPRDVLAYLDANQAKGQLARFGNMAFLLYVSYILDLHTQIAEICGCIQHGLEEGFTAEHEADIRRHCELLMQFE